MKTGCKQALSDTPWTRWQAVAQAFSHWQCGGQGFSPLSSTDITAVQSLKFVGWQGCVKTPVKIRSILRVMASVRVRQRKDGSSYTAVLYVLNGKQTSSSFNDPAEALRFQELANRTSPAKALEVWATQAPAADEFTVA